jgi:serine/threonine protein kinase
MAYFLTPQGQLELKVIDFGGAFRANTVNEACKQIVTGTVLYMSPEQVFEIYVLQLILEIN